MFDRKTFLSFFSLYGSLLDKFILSFSPCSPELINRLHLHHSFYFFLFLHSSVLSFPSYRSKCFSESDIDSSSSGFDSPSVELDLTDAFTSGRFSASRVKDKLATTISSLSFDISLSLSPFLSLSLSHLSLSLSLSLSLLSLSPFLSLSLSPFLLAFILHSVRHLPAPVNFKTSLTIMYSPHAICLPFLFSFSLLFLCFVWFHWLSFL
ncbi:unnamed protein product [Acanthosepion pharaonis]|uniref:Uncharacterized protein n=1 Tax=Acanthosepion pharaonis TaxID=158019 RepID=A0A812CQW3_ACAPH|nr:unnamed protein product [Sepia pharaonis]